MPGADGPAAEPHGPDHPAADAEPTIRPTPRPASQSTPEPASQSTPEPASQSTPEPASQSTPEPASQSTAEPATRPAEPTPGRLSRSCSTAIRILVAVLCGLLGFALVVQVQRTVSGDNLATARPDDLVQILNGLQRREDDLNGEISALQDTLGRLKSSGASSEEALAEAQRQAEALGILTGTVPATGPGVSMVIADPQNRIPPEVLLDAIQELRNAGAEAFQVGDVRIGVDSAFTGSAGAIKLDGTPLTAPYTIEAIGDPPTLAAALAIPGGVLDTVRRAGGTMDVSQSDSIVIDQLRAPRTALYARPADG